MKAQLVNSALPDAPQPVTRAQRRTRATDTAISLIHTYHAALTDASHLMAIPVLADDTVAYVLDRLSEATGPVVLILPQAGGTSRIVTLVDRSELATDAQFAHDGSPQITRWPAISNDVSLSEGSD